MGRDCHIEQASEQSLSEAEPRNT